MTVWSGVPVVKRVEDFCLKALAKGIGDREFEDGAFTLPTYLPNRVRKGNVFLT